MDLPFSSITKASAPSATDERSCGDCGLCCRLLAVDEINKPSHQWCRHFSPGLGCEIHAERPAACRSFRCLWLQRSELGPEWQPNRSHLVLHLDPADLQLIVSVDPQHPRAWLEAPFHNAIRGWAERGLEEGLQVIVKIGQRIIAVLPDREIELGELADDERIRVSRVRTPEGIGLVARLVKKG